MVLLLGALAATGLMLWDAGRRPAGPPPAAAVGAATSPSLEEGVVDPGTGGGADEPAEVTVHVSGSVRAPGVVTLPAGSRVAEAIAAVGGVVTGADVDRLNLARVIGDGEQVHVPEVGEPGPVPGEGSGSVGFDAEGRVDLNRATQEELETLPGIGPAKAAAIITHRETDGPFATPGDLRAVPGIGERTFQQLADLVTVG